MTGTTPYKSYKVFLADEVKFSYPILYVVVHYFINDSFLFYCPLFWLWTCAIRNFETNKTRQDQESAKLLTTKIAVNTL